MNTQFQKERTEIHYPEGIYYYFNHLYDCNLRPDHCGIHPRLKHGRRRHIKDRIRNELHSGKGHWQRKKSVQEIIAQNENAVVEIKTEAVSRDNWMQNYVTEGAGSGVIVDTKGYILTCAHVVEGSNKIMVTLKDGTELEATLVGMDSQNDIAVIKIKANNLTAATYGDSSELSVGSLVVAIGNPLGELGGSASTGIISALDRELTVGNKKLNLTADGRFHQSGQLRRRSLRPVRQSDRYRRCKIHRL